VRHHENREAQRLLQGPDQRVEVAGSDRIEARGRLVEENDLRVECKRAGQGDALDHAAGKLGGVLVAVFWREAHHLQLGGGDFVKQPCGQIKVFPHWKLHVLQCGERGEQRSLLEQDAPAPLHGAPLLVACTSQIDAEHLDGALSLRQQADHRAKQHRLAAARGADEAQDLAAANIEIQMIQHYAGTEPDDEVAHPNGRLLYGRSHAMRHIPMEAKNMAKSPSSTITRKIDFTTEAVVCSPSDSALPFTLRPSAQATTPIASAMNGALIMPTWK
jgi:hypothetical protein